MAQKSLRHFFFRSRFLHLTLIIVLLMETLILLPTLFVIPRTSFMAAVLPGVLVELANQGRGEVKIRPLKENPFLTRAAELKARDMAERGYFSHIGPRGEKPWYWLDLVGYDYLYAGENLAINFNDSVEVNRAWMNSITHKENILKKEFREIGLGVAEGNFNGRRGLVVVQFFGTSASILGEDLNDQKKAYSPNSLLALVQFSDSDRLTNFLFKYLTSPSTFGNLLLTVILILIFISLFFKLTDNPSKISSAYWFKLTLTVILILVLMWLNRFVSSKDLRIAGLFFGFPSGFCVNIDHLAREKSVC